MAYTKLFNSIITSTIWSEDDKTRIVWITMLAIADKNGEVQGSIPGLARIAGVPVEDTRAAINKFLAPDPDSRTKDDEGRRIEEIDGGWHLLNHRKYREMASKEEAKEAEAKRKARYRAKVARNEMSQSVPDKSQEVPERSHIAEAKANTEANTEANTDPKEEEKKQKPKAPIGEEDEIFGTWNVMAGQTGLPKIAKSSTERRAKAKTRLRDQFFRDNWREGIEAFKERSFLRGQNDRGWVATIDWFLKPESLIRIIEGQYKDKTPTQPELTPRCSAGEMTPVSRPIEVWSPPHDA